MARDHRMINAHGTRAHEAHRTSDDGSLGELASQMLSIAVVMLGITTALAWIALR